MEIILDLFVVLYGCLIIIGWFIAPIGILISVISIIFSIYYKTKKTTIILLFILAILIISYIIANNFSLQQD